MKYYANHFFLFAKYLVLFLLVYQTPIFSQQPLTTIEEEKFELAHGLNGSANYSYYLEGGNRYYHGPFYFNSSRNDSVDINIVRGVEFGGFYKEGFKNDNWTFSNMQLKEERSGIAVREPKYAIINTSSGVDFLIQAKFDKGQAEGKWSVGNFEIEQGVVVDTLFFSQADFAKNQFVGSFSSRNEDNEITGFLDENGFLNGVWVYNNDKKKIRESRQYEQGILIKHIIFIDGKKLTLDHIGLDNSYSPEMEEWDTLYLNENYLNILLYAKAAEGDNVKEISLFIRKSNDFLMTSVSSYNGTDGYSIWKNTAGSSGLLFPKVKARKFPYESNEKAQIDSANIKLYACESILDDFLSEPQVTISKHSNEDVSIYFAAFQIYQSELIKLRRLINVLSSKSAEYINKSEFIPSIFSGTSYPTSVSYSFNDENRNKEIDFPDDLSNKETTIQSIINHINQVESYLLEKEKIIAPIIEENKKRAEIADNEEILVSKKDSIIHLFGNLYDLPSFNSYHERYAENVINYIEYEFKQYAKEPVELRIDRIETQLECFQKFIEFYSFLANLPTRFKEVELLYTRTVWNPFTFTDMDEIVKERVFNSYNKIIIPYLLNELDESMSCDKIGERMMNFKILFKRMNTLRNQDTQDLESRLKRLTDIKDVLREFELNLIVE